MIMYDYVEHLSLHLIPRPEKLKNLFKSFYNYKAFMLNDRGLIPIGFTPVETDTNYHVVVPGYLRLIVDFVRDI